MTYTVAEMKKRAQEQGTCMRVPHRTKEMNAILWKMDIQTTQKKIIFFEKVGFDECQKNHRTSSM